MMEDKIIIVKKIIDKLRVKTSSTDEFIALNSHCIKELTALSPEYSQAIFDYAQELLDGLSNEEDNYEGYYFQVLVDSLIIRGEKQEAFLLASQALMSPSAEDDHQYVSFLIDVDLPESVPMLIKGLELMESFDEYAGHAQEKAIEYLMKKEIVEAYPVIEKCLFDEADRVRATALLFVKKFDKRESVKHLIKMLEDEDVEYNILIILDLLKKWKAKEALPKLKEYICEDWVYEDDDLLIPFEATIKSLSSDL